MSYKIPMRVAEVRLVYESKVKPEELDLLTREDIKALLDYWLSTK